MVETLLAVFERSRLNGSVLVVDDASPDGTGALADELGRRDSRVAVIHHRSAKEGLGPAYAAGFRQALELGANLVVQMDCDFSHDPNDVPRLVSAAADADLVLGSPDRAGWGSARLGPGTTLAEPGRLRLRANRARARVRDLTGGFKCYRGATLGPARARLDAGERLRVPDRDDRAHAYGRARGARGSVTFRDRTAGTSKMSARIALEALVLVPRLRLSGGGLALRRRTSRRRRSGHDGRALEILPRRQFGRSLLDQRPCKLFAGGRRVPRARRSLTDTSRVAGSRTSPRSPLISTSVRSS